MRDTPIVHENYLLSSEGIQEYDISPDLFPPGVSSYRAVFVITDEKNKEHKFEQTFAYDSRKDHYYATQTKDSLILSYKEYDTLATKSGTLFKIFENGDSTVIHDAILPLSIQDENQLKKIVFKTDKKIVINTPINRSLYNSIAKDVTQTKDSIKINLSSRLTAPMHYVIFKNNKVYKKGKAVDLTFTEKCNQNDVYKLRLVQNIAGNMSQNVETYDIKPNTKKLTVKANFPSEARPGSEVQVNLMVTDFYGQVVPNSAISSYGVKSTFGDSSITTAIHNPKFQESNLYVQNQNPPFRLNSKTMSYNGSRALRSSDIAKFDLYRNEYYQFFHPAHTIFQSDVSIMDTLAQVSVQAISGKTIYSPAYVTVDDIPVHYAPSSTENTVIVPTGNHRIQCRISDKLLDLGQINILPGTKKIISFNIDSVGTKNFPLILQDSLSAFYLDSLESIAILENSLLTNNFLHKKFEICFYEYCTRNLSGVRYKPVSLGGNTTFIWGPFYSKNKIASLSLDSANYSVDLAEREVLYFNNEQKIIQRTYVSPRTLLQCQVKELNFSSVLDTLYFPQETAKVKAEVESKAKINTSKAPQARIQISQSYAPTFDSIASTTVHLLSASYKVSGLWIVNKSNTAYSRYTASATQSGTVPRTGIVDIVIPLMTDTVLALKDIRIDSLSDIYVNVDSIMDHQISLEEQLFYQTIFSSLTTKYQKLFIHYPKEVDVAFKKIKGGRNNILLNGRLINAPSGVEDIFLKNGF